MSGFSIARDFPAVCGENLENCGVMSTERENLHDTFATGAIVGKEITDAFHYPQGMVPLFAQSNTNLGPTNVERPGNRVNAVTTSIPCVYDQPYAFDYREDWRQRMREALKGTEFESYEITQVYQFVCAPNGDFEGKALLTKGMGQMVLMHEPYYQTVKQAGPQTRVFVKKEGDKVTVTDNWFGLFDRGTVGSVDPIPSWFENLPELNKTYHDFYPYYNSVYAPYEAAEYYWGSRGQDLPILSNEGNCLNKRICNLEDGSTRIL